ncbi:MULTISPECIES: hypothetical protein [unclassified Corallococcus]|uniref:hypothetical protein n=1 Tax=unclassified Corallococcus TaxID=2685029 RepID=UPI001A8DE9B5|nr:MULTISPECIES: hypothetical protein [unclassified Corallococcus]MBN9681907.1 hypothetical protein [Corallococcus sp. NCSPR001]WAS86526.1 hypothetical protein O0N60_06010 [Corallococcus sp. NCRR]
MSAILHLPPRLMSWLPARPWLQVRGAARPSLEWEGREVATFTLLEAASGLRVDQLPLLLGAHRPATARPSRDLPFVVGPWLKKDVRDALEAQGVGYLDSRGHLHLHARGVLLHIEAERTAAREKPPGTATLGVHGVRAVQVLLQGEQPLSVSRFAEQASVSLGQAHKLLTWLEQLELVRAEGRGPAKRRTVRDRTGLLDWLERQAPATRRERSLHVALYARRPEELWQQTRTRLGKAGIAHALTGSAAVSMFGVGPTSVPVSRIRISPEVPLDQAAKHLDAEVTERGANLMLIHDTGRVGTWASTSRDGVLLAPPVRIYLDVRTERRGEDLARHFREEVLGY